MLYYIYIYIYTLILILLIIHITIIVNFNLVAPAHPLPPHLLHGQPQYELARGIVADEDA